MGSISDLIQNEGLECHGSQVVLSFLAGELLGYRDEGIELSPTILFCTDANTVFSSFPGSVRHVIGKGQLDPTSVKRILKDCAALATRSWGIYVERISSVELQYGVFNYIASPTTIPLADAISITAGAICLLMRKVGHSTIEVKGSKGHELLLGFSTTKEEDAERENAIRPFARDCCSDIPSTLLAKDFVDYMERLIEAGLGRCHGTILACTETKSLSALGDLRDGIEISPKLDFFSAYGSFRSDSSADSILRLQSAEELFNGILQCDGIVLMDTVGCICAYRVFYGPSQGAPGIASIPSGGARRRAYEGVKQLVGTKLKSVLFRSQDGLTLREGGQ